MNKIIKAIGWILVCQMAGIIGAGLTATSVQTWYVTLNKPWFTPPNWLFGPMWLTLYTLMGIATYIISQKKTKQAKSAVKFFLIHLLVNALWSPIFFGLKQVFLALVVIAIMWVMIAILIGKYGRISKWASWMLVPYLMWVSIATALNFEVWRLN